MSKLRGIITALVTPFNEDGSINYETYQILIEEQLKAGVKGLVIGGTTGEGFSNKEQIESLVSFACQIVKKRTLIIATVTQINKEKLQEQIKLLTAYPLDYLLVTTPYYLLTNEEGLLKYYEYVANISTVPIIVYYVPKRTGQIIELQVMQKILQLNNIAGIKDASGDTNYFKSLCETIPDKSILCGYDEGYLECLKCGGDGIISVFSNLFLEKLQKININSDSLFNKYLPLIKFLSCEPNPLPIKYLMNLKGYNVGHPRFPLTALCLKNKQQGKELLKRVEEDV